MHIKNLCVLFLKVLYNEYHIKIISHKTKTCSMNNDIKIIGVIISFFIKIWYQNGSILAKTKSML